MTAGNRSAYASAHGLRYHDGRVLATVELRENSTLPAQFDVRIRARHGNRLDAYVPVCELVPVSRHQNVSFVRPPDDLEAQEPTEGGRY